MFRTMGYVMDGAICVGLLAASAMGQQPSWFQSGGFGQQAQLQPVPQQYWPQQPCQQYQQGQGSYQWQAAQQTSPASPYIAFPYYYQPSQTYYYQQPCWQQPCYNYPWYYCR